MSAKKINSLESSSKKKELVKRHEIEGTPFTIVEAEGGFWGTMGRYRLTEKLVTREAVEAEIMPHTWNNLTRMMVLVNDSMNNKNK